MHDWRLALRLLRKDKAFSLMAGLTLAVCIGANTALFAIVDNVLLQPLTIPESDRVLLVYNSYPKAGVEHAGATAPDYVDRLRETSVFEEQALFNTRDPSLDLNGAPERVHTMQVTPSFFRLVRVPPPNGRRFSDEEGEVGKNHEVILSYGLGKRLFGDRESVGKSVRIDGEPYTVVGVMPPDFVFIDAHVQAWVPLALTDRQKTQRYSNNWSYLARLKAGATIAQAQAQIDALNAANLERFPEAKQVLASTGFHTIVTRLQDDLVRDVRATLYLLWGGALFVLLIGCVNVAGLVLVRSRFRLKELATRMALGAGRWRIVRQLVTEYLLLAIVSAMGGLLIGYVSLRWFNTTGIEGLPRSTEIRMDAVVMAYTMMTAGLIGIVLGTIPVVGLPLSLTTALREDGRIGTTGRGVKAMRRALVIVQVSVAFVLLIGAGLLLASFFRVLAIDPGFTSDGVLTASFNLPQVRYSNDTATRRFAEDALQALRSVPGVIAAGATTAIPLGDDFSENVIFPEGYRMNPGDSLIAAYYSIVTPGYFEAMRVRLVSGRFFDDRDTTNSPKTVIVDERLARRYWPGLNPVGRRMFEPSDGKDILATNDKTQWFTVVGVVGEVKLRGLVEGVSDTGAYYMPQAQRPNRGLTLTIRTAGAPASIASSVRAKVGGLDRELPLFDVKTMTARTDEALAMRRLPMLLAMIFGGVALFLAAIGLYSVLANLVSQRTKEIGIRMALGSPTAAVFQLVLREGIWLIALGFALGAGGAIALGRSLESQLFGVRASDPTVLLTTGVLLALVGIWACALPARRATRIDPAIALAK